MIDILILKKDDLDSNLFWLKGVQSELQPWSLNQLHSFLDD